MHIRLSTEADKSSISTLMSYCFGDREQYGALDDLNSRYILAFDEDILVAMTGIIFNTDYNAFEIDWTCTHPQYQRRGIMHELFKRVCNLTDEVIYCSCWRYENEPQVNLHSLMRDFGFKEVVRNKISCDSRYNCPASRSGLCAAFNVDAEYCRCYEDLYVREIL